MVELVYYGDARIRDRLLIHRNEANPYAKL